MATANSLLSGAMTRELKRPVPRLALSRAEVAISIGVSASSVDIMVQEGALPPPRLWHSRKLWIVSEIEAHLLEWPIEDDRAAWARAHSTDDQNLPALPAKNMLQNAAKTDHRMAKWCKDIGFDPDTMNDAELSALLLSQQQRWRDSVPGSPLGKRERGLLAALVERGVGSPVPTRSLKECGGLTCEMLELRGFITTAGSAKFPDRQITVTLTEKGLRAAKEQNL